MYYSTNYYIKGYCEPLNITKTLKKDSITIAEDLNDIITYLYEKHYNIPYDELSWYLEPGAKEFVKDIEYRWLHNTLDTTSICQDKDFVKSLLLKECELSTDDLDDLKIKFETFIDKKLQSLDDQTIRDLYSSCGDGVEYTIYSESKIGTQILNNGLVLLPELDEQIV